MTGTSDLKSQLWFRDGFDDPSLRSKRAGRFLKARSSCLMDWKIICGALTIL